MFWLLVFGLLSSCSVYQNYVAPYTQLVTGDLEVKRLVQEAETLEQQEKWDKALLSYEQAQKRLIDKKQKVPYVILMGLGRTYLKTNQVNKACPFFREAITQDLSLDAKTQFAQCLFLDGNFKDSQRIYQELIQTKPDEASFYDGLGQTFDGQKDYLSAQKQYKKAIELNPSFREAKSRLGYGYAQTGHFKEAFNLLEPLASDSKAYREDYRHLATAYALSGDKEKAKVLLSKVVSQNQLDEEVNKILSTS